MNPNRGNPRAEAWLIAALCTGVVACEGPAVTPHAPAPARYTDTGLLEPGVVPDERITAVLYRELEADRIVAGEQIGVLSEDGIVTLQASVPTHLAKERVVAIAHVVRGVRAIIDRIVVVPRPREDQQLEVVVATLLSNDPVTHGQRIAARAHDGTVELSGEVESYATRQAAEDDVLGIPGVVRVADDLAVFPRKRSDVRLTEAVKRTLADDPWIDDANVRVSSDRGRVIMTGFVGSDAEKVRAEHDAEMASPKGIEDAHLRVDPWTDDGTLRAKPPLSRGDREIGQSVLDAYVADPRVHPFVPTVDVRDKVVVLTGIAPNVEARDAALQDAGNTSGVVDVRDDMKLVDAVAHRSDEEIRKEVVEAIVRDGRMRRLHLSVDVQDGRVYLRGTVHREADRLHAIALATSAPGARNVEDGIVLVPQLGVTNPQPPSP
jgi:osmotically-inducible protein OsmY